jgi:hypothetical protein
VIAEYDYGVLPDGTELKVSNSGYNMRIVNPSVPKTVLTAYIKFYFGGAIYNPKGPVTLKILIPESDRADAENLVVTMEEGPGLGLVQQSAHVEGNYLVFVPKYI